MVDDDASEDAGAGAALPGRLLDWLPHGKAIGIRVIGGEPSKAVLMIPYDPRLVGDPKSGVIHGGAVTTLLDTCCAAAVFQTVADLASVATLDLRIDYMRAAAAGRPITAEAHCYRATRLIAFVRAVAYNTDPADPVASAAGAFMIERRPQAGAA